MKKHMYEFTRNTNIDVLNKMKSSYEWMILNKTHKKNLKSFDIDQKWLERFLYSTDIAAETEVPFETIVKLKYLFDIDFYELIRYNAYVYFKKNPKKKMKLEGGEEMLKQYEIGKKWEDTIIDYYNKRGYFTYKIPTMNNGTVFDIIAVRKGAALMIECKHTTSDRLGYKSSGIYKKRDELDHFVETTGNNVYIYVNSDVTDTWWTTWVKAKPIFESKGFITNKDCFTCTLDAQEEAK